MKHISELLKESDIMIKARTHHSNKRKPHKRDLSAKEKNKITQQTENINKILNKVKTTTI